MLLDVLRGFTGAHNVVYDAKKCSQGSVVENVCHDIFYAYAFMRPIQLYGVSDNTYIKAAALAITAHGLIVHKGYKIQTLIPYGLACSRIYLIASGLGNPRTRLTALVALATTGFDAWMTSSKPNNRLSDFYHRIAWWPAAIARMIVTPLTTEQITVASRAALTLIREFSAR